MGTGFFSLSGDENAPIFLARAFGARVHLVLYCVWEGAQNTRTRESVILARLDKRVPMCMF